MSDNRECAGPRFCPKLRRDHGASRKRRLGPAQWLVIEAILGTELEPINIDEAFEESVRECHSQTVSVLWMNLDAVQIAQKMDPVWWSIAKSEWLDQEVDAEQVVAVHGVTDYFWKHGIEELLSGI